MIQNAAVEHGKPGAREGPEEAHITLTHHLENRFAEALDAVLDAIITGSATVVTQTRGRELPRQTVHTAGAVT